GQLVVTGTSARTAQLWETATGKPVGATIKHVEIKHPGNAKTGDLIVAFGRDDRSLITGIGSDLTSVLESAVVNAPLPFMAHSEGQIAEERLQSMIEPFGRPDGLVDHSSGLSRPINFYRHPLMALSHWESATGKSLGPPFTGFQSLAPIALLAFSPD